MANLPYIQVITTGGTIASRRDGAGPGYAPALGGQELLAEIPDWQELARVEVREFGRVTSFMFTYSDLVRLIAAVRAAASRTEVDGVVVVQGTAAMEEMAYLLDITVGGNKPVVVTGAMINASQPGRDGPRNIRDALRVAADPEARGRGTLVVMAGEAHAARSVQKLHRTAVTAFVSWPDGPMALADADRLVWLRPPRGRVHLPVDEPAQPVDVIAVTLASDDRLIRASMASGVRGLVLEGFPGGGGVTPAVMSAVQDALATGLPVAVASRSPLGRSLPGAGGGAGPRDLAAAGAILAGDLSAAKTRILLMCALAHDPNRVQETFALVVP